MATPGMILGSAGDREAGVACPHCRVRIEYGDPVALCQSCGNAHHAGCWQGAGGCGSYSCAPATTTATSGAALRITTDEVRRAVPMERATHSFEPPRSPTRRPPAPRRRLGMHPLAIISLIMGLLAAAPSLLLLVVRPEGVTTGLVVVGTILVAFLTIILASVALGSVLRGRYKGGVPAGFGLVLALGDVAGVLLIAFLLHAGGLAMLPGGGGAPIQFNDMEPPDPADLEGMDPASERALRANVLIQSTGDFLSGSLGSGVIVKVANGQATVLTNRHVIDPSFRGGPSEPGDLGDLHPNVRLIGQENQPGRVTWIAPGGIDLAVIEVPCVSDEVQTAKWQTDRKAVIRKTVFAVGNPNGQVWSLTTGTVSAFRKQEISNRDVRVIQIDTPLNPGNSGGGLYDNQGFLLGINTWAQDKSKSEGLNYAIELESVLELLPVGVKPSNPVVEAKPADVID